MAKEEREESLFIPSLNIEKRYKEQIKFLLESNGAKSALIDMGHLPEVYTIFGIKDKELKTNGKTILKALGLEGHNKHNVSKETIENLLSLTYDPEAVFKSLSTSDNPDSYVAVLNAKAFNQKQIIAILSPSRNGQGFTFIPSVYERNKFEQFINQTYYENRILYIKDKGSQLWGQLQSLPRHNQEPSTKNILTKSDIVKHFKEKNMSDTFTYEKDRIASLAEDITTFKSFIRQNNEEKEPLLNTDFQLAFDCLKSYIAVFGDESLTYLENKFTDKTDIKIIEKLINKIETPLLLRHENREDKKAHYKEFVESERKEINAFTAENQKQEIKNGETPSLERRNINSKEKIMSDENQDVSADDYLSSLNTTVPLGDEKKELSPKEQAYREAVLIAKHQRKVVADAIKDGTLSCLPGKDGYADTTPAVNIMHPDKPYHAEYQIYFKAVQKQKENGFPTAEYVTYYQIDKAREEGVKVYVREGQKPESMIIGEQKDNGEWENKKIKVFNVAQLTNPKAFKEWAVKEIEKQEQKELEKKQAMYGTGYKLPEKKSKEHGPEIVCSSTEPEKYLAQYLAAVSMGSKFKVSPLQAAEFSEKMVNTLYAPMQERTTKEGKVIPPPLNKETQQPISDPFNFENLSRKANEECKVFMRDLRMKMQKQNQPEQKQEQIQSIGRSM